MATYPGTDEARIAKDRLAAHYFRGGHSFPADARERAYSWFDRWLKPA